MVAALRGHDVDFASLGWPATMAITLRVDLSLQVPAPMDISDLFDELFQDVSMKPLINQVRRLEDERKLDNGDFRTTKELAAENVELKLRLSLLVRLLVSKNVITAVEYAALLAEARPKPPRTPS